MERILELIETLQSSESYHFIDVLPETISHAGYFELEEYLLVNCLDDFSQKICRIIIKLITYYDAEIYLTEFPEEKSRLKFYEYEYKNIRSKSLQEIHKIISYIIKNGISSVQIIFPKKNILVSIHGEFSVAIYGENEEVLKLVEKLVNQENLFLRKSIS
ncbi:hypothetical protein [Tepidibacter thalassicus]|uniref:Uncharacterized protein n=1 Tax=Tepidibacter thalassicus DSM 15285 TaxID=1123350 RepID=A0A1M5RM38_9FIRM|nr:hypothetical protein [Tepidibacter thalassicus]SHH27240.1 hypothetical protein SAMN02744040_01436 [Tepidibacter thalassicus DSM 15285]